MYIETDLQNELGLEPGDIIFSADHLDEQNAFVEAGLLAQFPDEIWEEIFVQVKHQASWEELLKYSRVCTKWERFLKADECNWLFEQILPHIFPYLRTPDIFLMRLVNKTWHHVMDNWVQNHKHWQPFAEQTHTLSPERISIDSLWDFGVTCSSTNNLTKLIEKMGIHSIGNPFPGRSFYLKLKPWDTVEERQHLRNVISSYFKTYGSHLWRFSICAPFSLTVRPTYDYDSFLGLVQLCLVHMPQLKTLHIRGFLTFGGNLTRPEEESLLQVLTESHPFPLNYSPSLETLLINTVGVPAAVRTYVTSQFAAQLKCLRYLPYVENYQFMSKVTLADLTEFYTAIPSNKSLNEFDSFLRAVAGTSPRLKKLKLRLLPLEEPDNFDVRRFFELFSVLSKSLNWLYLDFVNGDYGVNYPTKMEISLPVLQRLTLRGFTNFPLTLLINSFSASLEFLEIYNWCGDKGTTDSHNDAALSKHLDSRTFINLNVWDSLPKLKVIGCHVNGSDRLIRRLQTSNK